MECEKFKDSDVDGLLLHVTRELSNDKNMDIIEEKKVLNYSITPDYNGRSAKEYYKDLIDSSYIYGRGTKREKETVTCFSWVITLPKQISDYSSVRRDEIVKLNESEEALFFQAAFDFINTRYPGSILRADLHYDEAGQPHGHYYIAARKPLDHDQLHYKTVKTNHTADKKKEAWKESTDGNSLINRKGETVATRTESGRWEYVTRFKLDEDGNRIPLKNYARISDYYDYKLACSEIINPIELRYFHPDFAEYLRKNNLPGADHVHTGVTGGKNISVNELKMFTRSTGLTLEQVREMDEKSISLEKTIVGLKEEINALSLALKEKDLTIAALDQQIREKEMAIKRLTSLNIHHDTNIEHNTGNISRWDKGISHEHTYDYGL